MSLMQRIRGFFSSDADRLSGERLLSDKKNRKNRIDSRGNKRYNKL